MSDFFIVFEEWLKDYRWRPKYDESIFGFGEVSCAGFEFGYYGTVPIAASVILFDILSKAFYTNDIWWRWQTCTSNKLK